MTTNHLYCPCYCEENVWHLCGDDQVPAGPRAAVFISNAVRQLAIAHQRAAIAPTMPVVWDYHVVMARADPVGWRIWDLDSTLGLNVELVEWLAASLRFESPAPPLFRVMSAHEYRTTLRSDRSHMRNAQGEYYAPVPPWPAIGDGGSNVMRFVDMEPGFVGEVVGLGDLHAALGRTLAS